MTIIAMQTVSWFQLDENIKLIFVKKAFRLRENHIYVPVKIIIKKNTEAYQGPPPAYKMQNVEAVVNGQSSPSYIFVEVLVAPLEQT